MGNDLDQLGSDYLFARPSFVEGVARIVDLPNSLNEYNRSGDPDSRAIGRDWKAIGRDVQTALEQLRTDPGK